MGSWRREVRAQLRLAVPVAVVQVGLMAMGLVDGMFLGRVSAEDYAATSIGHAWSFWWTIFGFGVLTSLDPLTSQAWGARDHPAIARALQRGLVLAGVLCVPLSAGIAFAGPFFRAMGQPDEVEPLATAYALVQIAGVPAFLVFVALRAALQAMHRLRPLVVVILVTNGINAFLDWVLVFGHLGAPPMGAVGSSWATVVSRWAMAVLLLVAAWPVLRPYLVPWRRDVLRPRPLARMVGIGWPIGMQFAIELGAFALITLLMGSFGADEIAGHQVALSLASASFMVPLGISMAAAVRVGNEVGRGDERGARRAAVVALCAGAGVMLLSATCFAVVPRPLARIFTDEEGVLAVAVTLLPIAAVFQVFDGTQVVASGILRGIADTRVPMLLHLFGFWLVGLPLGLGLAFGRGIGPAGLWWGLVGGLGSAALVLFLRVRVRLARALARVDVGDEPPPAPGAGSP